MLKLLKSRRAISAVVSNLILIGAVIAVGFAALAWTTSSSNNYAFQYGGTVQSNTNQLEERIAFEYIFYNRTAPTSLSAYVINCGNIGTVSLTTGYVSNSSWKGSSFVISLHYFNESTGATRVLGIGQEGYFLQSSIAGIISGNSYTVNIATGRGSTFAGTFTA